MYRDLPFPLSRGLLDTSSGSKEQVGKWTDRVYAGSPLLCNALHAIGKHNIAKQIILFEWNDIQSSSNYIPLHYIMVQRLYAYSRRRVI